MLRNRYVGYWKLGQRHGRGAFYYSNGSKYEGNWVENFKHGDGCFTFEDGTQYVGKFEKDRMVGRDIANKDAEDFKKQETLGQKTPAASVGKSEKTPATSKNTPADPKKKDDKKGSADAASKAGANLASSNAKYASNKAKKEVEENPFRKLIDISDLMELEARPDDCLKEIQNCLLRHNSELKQWYKTYSRKIEVHKSEESFAMTLK
jgi:hypothetical protein